MNLFDLKNNYWFHSNEESVSQSTIKCIIQYLEELEIRIKELESKEVKE